MVNVLDVLNQGVCVSVRSYLKAAGSPKAPSPYPWSWSHRSAVFNQPNHLELRTGGPILLLLLYFISFFFPFLPFVLHVSKEVIKLSWLFFNASLSPAFIQANYFPTFTREHDETKVASLDNSRPVLNLGLQFNYFASSVSYLFFVSKQMKIVKTTHHIQWCHNVLWSTQHFNIFSNMKNKSSKF